MVLSLGGVGIRSLPGEDTVVASMRAAVREPGFYLFPGMETPPGAGSEQKQAIQRQWEDKYRKGPRGVLIYHHLSPDR